MNSPTKFTPDMQEELTKAIKMEELAETYKELKLVPWQRPGATFGTRRGASDSGGLVVSIEARGGQPKAVRIYPSLFRTIFVVVDVFLLPNIAVSIHTLCLLDRIFSCSEPLVILPFAGLARIHLEELRWQQRRRHAAPFPDQESDPFGRREVFKRPAHLHVRLTISTRYAFSYSCYNLFSYSFILVSFCQGCLHSRPPSRGVLGSVGNGFVGH
jgi:hypothetical protein